MRLDQLQLDLRPRSNAQALDLGFALLRANAARVYAVWLTLWIPAMMISMAFSHWLFDDVQHQLTYSFILAWWLRPWLERAPLHILSRQVFGEQVGYLETLKAWPKQLGGGLLRLFFLRPFAAGRGLYQAIWLLEGARGKTARYRIRIIGRRTASSATWFGLACAHFEAILQIGFYALVGFFMSDSEAVNPFALFMGTDPDHLHLLALCGFIGYTAGAGLIGPIYTACTFTLYLNRRSTLEAWDLEIALRQIAEIPNKESSTRQAKRLSSVSANLLIWGLVAALSSLGLHQEVQATTASKAVSYDIPQCDQETLIDHYKSDREPTTDPTIARTRESIDQIYSHEDFKLYRCEKRWVRKEKKEGKKNLDPTDISETMKVIALALKYITIGLGIFFLVWLILRYRGQLFSFETNRKMQMATEVAGLDIRPESLPDEITKSVLELWRQGQQRAAIGLLYRASLAHLVEHHAMHINKGATEQDCLHLTHNLLVEGTLISEKYHCFAACTEVWLRAAYAHQYPSELNTLCTQWATHFEQGVQA